MQNIEKIEDSQKLFQIHPFQYLDQNKNRRDKY